MALPNGAGGYQIGDGNINEINFEDFGPAVTYTAAASPLNVSDLTSAIIVFNSGSGANLQLPTAPALEAVVSSARPNTGFQFSVIAPGAGAATLTTNTGWTITGSAVVAAGTSARFAAIKSSVNNWLLYRMS